LAGGTGMRKQYIREELSEHNRNISRKCIPFDELNQRVDELSISNDLIDAFIEYTMTIDGCITCIIGNPPRKINSYTKKFLKNGFFSSYPQFKCIEGNIDRYLEFKRLLVNYEMARLLVVEYVENCS
jgi:hypothetical protein